MNIRNSHYSEAVKKLEAKRAEVLARRFGVKPSKKKTKKNDSEN